jgi:predicted Zn-dependent protease
MGSGALMFVLFGGSDLGSLVQTATRVGGLSYDRAQELEADDRGVALLTAANIDPGGMAAFFQRLAQDSIRPPEILSTHPDPGERAALIQSAQGGGPYAQLPSPQGIACHTDQRQAPQW